MKVIYKLDDVKIAVEYKNAETWDEAVSLCNSLLKAVFPYLTTAQIVDHMKETNWDLSIPKEVVVPPTETTVEPERKKVRKAKKKTILEANEVDEILKEIQEDEAND